MRLPRIALAALLAAAAGAGTLVMPTGGGPAANAAGAGGELVFNGVRWGTASVAPRIWRVGVDGRAMRRLTDARDVEDTSPAWSPDGQRIAFGRGGRLMVMRPDGGGVRAMTPRYTTAGAPAWSPDARRIAFEWMPLHLPGGTVAQQVAVVDADGAGRRTLTRYATFKGGAGHPAWSPDGRTILFAGRSSMREGAKSAIWAVRPDGTGLRRLLADAGEPAWSPDGRTIAFSRGGNLFTARPTGGSVRQLTHGSYADASAPAWSPDGARIAFSTMHYNRQKEAIGSCLTIVDRDGSGLHEITRRDRDFWAEAPDWRPAG